MKPPARGICAALNFLSAYRVSFETFELTHNNRLDRLGGPLWHRSQEPSSMKASTLFSIVAAVFLGLVVVAAAKYSGFFEKKQPPPPVAKQKVKVLVAAKNLFESYAILPGEVRVRDMTPDEEKHYEKDKDKYLPANVEAGHMRVLTRSVEADQPLLREYVDDINLPQAINRRLSSPTMRAVNVAVPIDRAAGGLIRRGEYVDVYLTTRISVAGKPESTTTETAPIARNLKVIVKRNMLWNVMAAVDPKKPIDYTLEANAYRAALIEYAKIKGELALVPTAAPQELQKSASRNIVAAVTAIPPARSTRTRTNALPSSSRTANAPSAKSTSNASSTSSRLKSKVAPSRVEKYTGVHYQGVQTFSSNGNGPVRPNTSASRTSYQFAPIGPSKANDTDANNIG